MHVRLSSPRAARATQTARAARTTKAALAAAVLAAVLAACAGSATPSAAPAAVAANGATIPLLTAGDYAPYSNIDPAKTQGCNDNYCGLFMEHLLELGPHNTLEPELATSVSNPDPLTYIYHLRHGVAFWDGHPMTSADVVYSLDYQSKPGVPTSVYFTSVKSILADGPDTVVIKLKQPNAGWKYSLSYEGVIFEKSFALAHKGTLGNPGVLIQATGPWEIKSLDPTTGMEMSANPHWWGGKVPIQHITIKVFASETSEALAMRAGEIDLAFPGNGKPFATASGAPVTSWSPPSIYFLAMDPNVAPWNDVHVRRAVAYALNRPQLVAANGGSLTAAPASSLIPPSQLAELGTPSQVSAMLSGLPQYPYSLAKARQELAKSRYPHGFSASTEIDSSGNDANVAQVISAELHKIGITLKVNGVSENKYFADYSAKGGPPGGDMFAALYAASPDPSIFPSYMIGQAATYNVAQYAPAGADQLLAQGLAASSRARRLSIYGQVLKMVATDVPYVALFAGHNYTALSSKYTLPPFTVYPAFSSWALHLKLAS